jgi:XTP/dITP diphosphohydrolase
MMNPKREGQLKAFGQLLDIMEELRAKCPWDKEQTNESLRTLTIEETYELADAIIKGDNQLIKKELGDILLHIVFYARIGEESNAFDIKDVVDQLNEKLVYRHPHIFGNVEVNNALEVEQNWEQLKLKEKDGNKSVLSGVPVSLPALVKANRIQDKARGVGFDWEVREQVWGKVNEELGELEVELKSGDADKMEQEFGDLLFSLINVGRLYGINPENALERTNRKFISRFNYLESKTIAQGRNLKEMTLAEMDEIWDEAKRLERQDNK